MATHKSVNTEFNNVWELAGMAVVHNMVRARLSHQGQQPSGDKTGVTDMPIVLAENRDL